MPGTGRRPIGRSSICRPPLTTLGPIVAAAALAGAWSPACGLKAQEEIGKKERVKIAIEWANMESKSYAVEYESVIPAPTVRQVAEELDAALEQYIAVFRFKPKERFKVKVLDNLNTYEQEGGDPSHPGYFNPGSGYLVLRNRPFFDLIPTAYHEAFHQYIQAYMGDGIEIPIWFNEGLAVYFEGIQKNKSTKKLDFELIDNRRMRRIQEAIMTRSALPLAKLIDATPKQFHEKDKEELHYSQSFGVVYFLMQGMGGKPVHAYANELRETKDVAKAEEKIFGKDRRNLPKVEAAWKSYVAQLKIQDPPPR